MKNKLDQKDINAEELKRAVGLFVKDGGIIQKLPDQKSVGHRQVGGKHAITELGGQSI